MRQIYQIIEVDDGYTIRRNSRFILTVSTLKEVHRWLDLNGGAEFSTEWQLHH